MDQPKSRKEEGNNEQREHLIAMEFAVLVLANQP